MESVISPPPLSKRVVTPPELPGVAKTKIEMLGRWLDFVIGVAALVVGLAVLAAVPVLNLLSLGYLLEAAGRTATSGRFRDGIVGVEKAARLGKMVLGTWLVLWPLRAVSQLADAAYLIEPGGIIATRWQRAVTLLMILTVCHVLWACLRGGRLRYFFWPAPIGFLRWLRTPQKYARVRDGVCDFAISLNLWRYFYLGLQGFVGAFTWLVMPLAILICASYLPEGAALLLSFIGVVHLAIVVTYLPYLQMNFCMRQELSAYFELGRVRAWRRRRPFLCFLGLMVVLVSPVPLYLLKIEMTPEEVTWLPAAVFVVFIWPAKLVLARIACASDSSKIDAKPWLRWGGRFGSVVIVIAYVLAVYVTQYLAWHGSWSLLEQHAFLVPSPF